MDKYDWLEQALCRGSDVNLFFPEVGVSYHQTDFIRDLCGNCPVKDECLELGLESGNDDYGFFGGKSPRDRQAIKAERARASRIAVRGTYGLPHNEPEKALELGIQKEADLA